MKDLVIRPTLRFIRMGYTTVFVLVAIALALASNIPEFPLWVAGGLALLLLWPAQRQLRRRFTIMTVKGDKLRYETGFLSKTTRTMQLSKIQDVAVRQSLLQRFFGIGDVSIETAGETGPLVVRNIDNPQEVADLIGESAQHPSGRGQGL
ncbi:MAG TPA: PH domain-containing protein [Bryobacteraceae bacterium]|nr:PH domain-containing protein [Bryobacteraceae bacterium]